MNIVDISDKRAPYIFVTKVGVRLKLRHVPSMVIVAAQKQLKQPVIPRWHNTDKDRDEDNPNDPGYLRELAEYNSKVGDITTDAYLVNGVTVLEPLPDSVYSIDSSEWAEGLEFIGIEVPKTGVARRLAWLKYYIVGDEDLADLIKSIAIAGGVVTEEQVQEALDSFRNNQTGSTNNEISIEKQD